MRLKVSGLVVALVLSASAGTTCAQTSLSRDQGLMMTRVVLGIETMSHRVNGSFE